MRRNLRLTESQLRNIVGKCVKRALNENTLDGEEVFTICAENIENEETVEDLRFNRDYESLDAAIDAARRFAQTLANDDDVIIVTVFCGEYRSGGDVYGETNDVYAISNKGRRETMAARKRAGYSKAEVDEYVGDDVVQERIRRRFR